MYLEDLTSVGTRAIAVVPVGIAVLDVGRAEDAQRQGALTDGERPAALAEDRALRGPDRLGRRPRPKGP